MGFNDDFFGDNSGSFTVTINLAKPDIAMLSAQLQTGNTVQFTYETTGNPGPFEVGLYRSADATFDASDILLDTQTVTPSPTNPQAPGTFTLASPWPSDPNKPYLVVVADPNDLISESNPNNNSQSIALPDIVATSLNIEDELRPKQALVTYSYRITGADLPADTEEALFWSENDTFEPDSDTLAFSFPIQGQDRRVGTYNRSIAESDLRRPARATHLLLVLDPPTGAMPDGTIKESDVTNNVKAFRLSDRGNPQRPPDGNTDNDDPPPAPILIPIPDLDELRKRAPRILPLPPGRPFFLAGDPGTSSSAPTGRSSNLTPPSGVSLPAGVLDRLFADPLGSDLGFLFGPSPRK
ncbi:MAG: hypothetical protein L0Z62_47830 [Gemmataceae bacterium]|nr:hypothetical protein [Gemmataceae bacterium]